MSTEPQPTKAGDRVHYCAWYLGFNDGRRYRAYAIRKQGENDLEAALRSIRRRLDRNAFEIGNPSALSDGTYSFRIFARLTRHVREDFGEGQIELRGLSPKRS